MRRISIFMLVALLAIAGVMGAMAFNEATITSGQTLKVTNTNQALLALKPGTGVGNLDETAYVEDGILQIDFGKGLGEVGFHGLQPASVYTWNNLVLIQNKSAETIEVDLELIGGAAQFAVAATVVDGTPGPNWFSEMIVWDGTSHTFELGPNYTISLRFALTIDDEAALGTYDGTMIVNAVAVP